MKKVLTVIMSISLSLVLVFTATSLSFATTQSTEEIDTRALNLETIDESELPEGIVPIEITSQEDFDSLVETLNQPMETEIQNFDNLELADMNKSSSSSTFITRSTTKNMPLSPVKLNLYAKIEVYSSGSFRQILNGSPWTTLTGYGPGVEWVEEDKDAVVQNNGQSIYVWSEGTFKYYLLINGLIQLYARDESISFTYSVY